MAFDFIPADVRYAVRTLSSGRLFTLVAVLCLALGIATNTTMFSVFDAMFLRPLPFKDADRLVSISGRHAETGRRVPLTLDDLRELAPALSSLEPSRLTAGRTVTLTDGGDPERIAVQRVTANLFPTLGVAPQRGRGIDTADDQLPAAGVALISDSLWRRRYQADPAVIGRAIRLDDVPYTIVGVMPPKFRFPSTSELWIADDACARRVGRGIAQRLDPRTTRAGRDARTRQRGAGVARAARARIARPARRAGARLRAAPSSAAKSARSPAR